MKPEAGEPVAGGLAPPVMPRQVDRPGPVQQGAAGSRELIAESADSQLQVADEEAVRRCLAGDRDAYAILVERYQGRIVGHVARMVGNREQALDVAQEAFLKAWLHLARYDPQWRFSTWLYSIASNAAIDQIRQRRRRMVFIDAPVSMEDGEMQRELPGPDRTAADDFEGKELQEKLEGAIDELPEEQRQLLLLRHPGGRSYEEIAEITRLPMGTVKNRIWRARQRLKERLGDLLPAGI